MLKDFKAFILRGNVLDLAVAVVIGAAFGAVVKSFTDDVIMPPIGLALGHIDFSNLFVVLKEGTKAPGPYTTVATVTTIALVVPATTSNINAATPMMAPASSAIPTIDR